MAAEEVLEVEEAVEAAERARRRKRAQGRLDEDDADFVGADHADGDAQDAVIEEAVAATALPSPGLVALQTRQAFESSDEYKKLNKTQRRKALQQWEAENEHIMAALRAEGKEPAEPKEPKEKKPEAPARKEKVHGSGRIAERSNTKEEEGRVHGQQGSGNSITYEGYTGTAAFKGAN